MFLIWRHKRLGVFQRWMSCKNIYLSIYKLVCNGSFLDIALRMFLVCFFKQTNKFCPNLIVYFGKVRWYKNNYYQINYLRITNFNEFTYKAPNLCNKMVLLLIYHCKKDLQFQVLSPRSFAWTSRTLFRNN